jgi:cytoskeletal protein RodZ
MSRIDVVAASRPRKQGVARARTGLRRFWQTLVVVPVVLLLAALLVPVSALAAEPTSGYSQTAPTPKTTPTSTTPTSTTPTSTTPPSTTPTATTPTSTTPPTPTSGTSPSKEATTPEKTTPAKEAAPTTTTSPSMPTSKAAALPFTGLDLRWSIAIGVLLIGLGCSILGVQRRQRGRSG